MSNITSLTTNNCPQSPPSLPQQPRTVLLRTIREETTPSQTGGESTFQPKNGYFSVGSVIKSPPSDESPDSSTSSGLTSSSTSLTSSSNSSAPSTSPALSRFLSLPRVQPPLPEDTLYARCKQILEGPPPCHDTLGVISIGEGTFKVDKKYSFLERGYVLVKSCEKGFVGSVIYVHRNKVLGGGGFKTTTSATMYCLTETGLKQKEIARQKLYCCNRRSQEAVDSLVAEAQFQQGLSCDHIIKIVKWVEYPGKRGPQAFIYFERCDTSLEKKIANNSLTPKKKAKYAAEIASALEYLHNKRYSHNDLKPDNLLIRKEKIKVIDFGHATLFGYPAYLCRKIKAPEQWENGTCNDKTDIYQFGLTLWSLYHPKPPLDLKGYSHLDEDYKYPLSDMFSDWDSEEYPEVRALIGRCLSENPEERPSAKEIAVLFNKLAAIQ